MNVLVIGGSGLVGSLIMPLLAQKHSVRVFDLRPPEDETLDYFEGDVTNYDDLVEAMNGMAAVIYMAMGHLDWDTTKGVTSAYDVNVKGLHLTLRAAHEVGITKAVYASTMSIYGGKLATRYFTDEAITPDALELYGFTKYLGEMVCQNAARLWGMNINALRLCHPVSEEKWLADYVPDEPYIPTVAQDVTNAMDAALTYEGGFQPFMISGDWEQRIMDMSKAKRLLGWQPMMRPR